MQKVLSPYWFLIPLLGLLCKTTNQKSEYLYLGDFHTPLLLIFTQTSTHLAYSNHCYHCSLKFFHQTLIFQPSCLFETHESIWAESKLCRLLAQVLLTPNVNANFSPLMFESFTCPLFMTHSFFSYSNVKLIERLIK